MRKLLPVLLIATLAMSAMPAAAGPFDNVFFVKRGGDARQMFADRTECAAVARNVGIGRGEAYSDPEYGVLSAMGAALDSDSLHGGIGKAVQRAALEKCMEKRGWVQRDPIGDDQKPVRKASASSPAALDSWIRSHEPEAPPAREAAAAPAPASTPAPAATSTPTLPAAPSQPAQAPATAPAVGAPAQMAPAPAARPAPGSTTTAPPAVTPAPAPSEAPMPGPKG